MTSPIPVTIRAHAKINLDLRVLGTRADGFHELRTVFQAISLYDTITCVPRDNCTSLTSAVTPPPAEALASTAISVMSCPSAEDADRIEVTEGIGAREVPVLHRVLVQPAGAEPPPEVPQARDHHLGDP